MKKFKSYYIMIYLIFNCFIYAENYFYHYSLNAGANLLSFSLSDNSSISDFFNNNPNIISNYNPQEHIISLISEGEIGININNEWQGSLENITADKGYWLIIDEPINFLYTGDNIHESTYFLHPGSNLISFPYENEIHINDALPIYSQDILLAIIGQNESLLIHNNQFYGSLTHFKPGNGYWFIANDHSIFEYDINNNRNNNSYKNIKNETSGFNQSILQSIYFTESIYLSGEKNDEEISLNIYCNDSLVGNKNWSGVYNDLIAMGNDGYDWTTGYCEFEQDIIIKNSSNEELYIIKGDNKWIPNNFNIITLSDIKSGDLNFDHIINIADIIILVEHIINTNTINNQHKLLLSDINQDQIINISDLILNIETIIN